MPTFYLKADAGSYVLFRKSTTRYTAAHPMGRDGTLAFTKRATPPAGWYPVVEVTKAEFALRLDAKWRRLERTYGGGVPGLVGTAPSNSWCYASDLGT